MESTRQNKIDRLIQKELSDMFVKMTKTYHGTLVTVTNVRVSSDLSVARVRVSIFPASKVKETMELLQNSVRGIRYELGTRVGRQIRIIPQLSSSSTTRWTTLRILTVCWPRIRKRQERSIPTSKKRKNPKNEILAVHCPALPVQQKETQRYQHRFNDLRRGYLCGYHCAGVHPLGLQRISGTDRKDVQHL